RMQRKQSSKRLVFLSLMAGAGLALLLAAHSPAFVFSLQTTMPHSAYTNESIDSIVVYQDTFGGMPGPLEGRLVETGGSAGATWITKDGFETDGNIASISTNASRVAALPFTPVAGERYRLSANISVSDDAWVALGFISDDITVNGREFFFNLIDNPAPWMNMTSLGIVNTFGGPSTADKIAFPNLGTNGTLIIELDTRGTHWIATYFMDETALRTNTFAGALFNINHVGFGNFSPADMTVDNFKLEIVGQPAEVSLTHNTYVPIYDFAQPSSDVDFFHRYLDEFDIHAHRMREDSDTALQSIVALQNTHGYRISCTSSDLRYQSTNGTQSGEICAQIVLDSVERFHSFSGEVTRLYIDHPWQLRWQENPTNDRLVVSTDMTMQESVDETIDFMEVIHNQYPDWEFFLLPNFVGYGWKGGRAYRSASGEALGVGDFHEEFTLVYSNALTAGLPLNGVLIDFPYPSAIGDTIPLADVYNGDPAEFDWMARIRDLESEVESRGLQFGIINNSYAGPANQGYTFYIDSLDFIDVYMGAPYYGSPALWAPRTWYANKPPEQVPEICLLNGGTANYTMSAIVNATIDRVKRPEVDGSLQAFNENGNKQGWIMQSSIANTEVTNGYYSATTTATDANISQTGLSIDGSANPVVEIAFATDAGSTARLYYQANGDTTWHGPTELSIVPDAEIHVYKL
ncbi:MAG: hypothetical protein U9P12_08245, partial [Verrucomicrobiota bacterium]|nr:hypothetical protein [Verrucomicrobiota bacterium]